MWVKSAGRSVSDPGSLRGPMRCLTALTFLSVIVELMFLKEGISLRIMNSASCPALFVYILVSGSGFFFSVKQLSSVITPTTPDLVSR